MKHLFWSLLLTALIPFGLANAADKSSAQTESKILIAYYSWSGNTKELAEAIQKEIGGTLFEIQTVQTYPEAYRATTEQAKKEIDENFKPKLKTKVDNIDQYDTVFIGSPNWWGTIAPAVSTFLADYDLSGKKVIPFITHGGGGVQNTVKNLTEQCKGCVVSNDPWSSYKSFKIGLSGWLKDLGYKK